MPPGRQPKVRQVLQAQMITWPTTGAMELNCIGRIPSIVNDKVNANVRITTRINETSGLDWIEWPLSQTYFIFYGCYMGIV